MVYFIADAHLGHWSIIPYCGRPFSSVEEQDALIIKNWRATVREDDDVYIIGDLMGEPAREPDYYLRQLSGRLHLLIGNHEDDWYDDCYRHYFVEVADALTVTLDGYRTYLCHYPTPDFVGDLHIYGHMHENYKDGDFRRLVAAGRFALNAAVELNGYRPVTIEEMIESNARFVASLRERGLLPE
jgi:calcineurin-like phosphoesterase family protein